MIYRTEDGHQVKTGDVVFNYYDRKIGRIGPDAADGWFDLEQEDGRKALLNGQRICSTAFAIGEGWITEDKLARVTAWFDAAASTEQGSKR